MSPSTNLTYNNSEGCFTFSNKISTLMVMQGLRLIFATSFSPCLYPNPATDQFTVESSAGIKINVRDMFGKLIATKDTICSSPCIFDCSDWSSGIYTVKMFDEVNKRRYNTTLVIE